ncbi:Transferase [Macleaya cordata]|uniref:Transferase n=1 Tax=Macleaya cordata TaxID=56857 RepID=A0A200PUT3_MACCD|nr:Transferase [Macleaya cordata]
MKVEVVSRETIKPSSPTPHHLRTFNLSFLDQIAPPTIDGDHNENYKSRRCDVMKKSLSESLTRFYPLAGRIKDDDDSSVDCNDDGVDYLEAKVTNGGGLSQFIQDPDVNVQRRFLPFQPFDIDPSDEATSKVLLAVQVSIFDDSAGGIVIGMCISHRLADASSLSTFINDWAATARGATDEQINKGPCFELPTLFPKVDLMGYTPPRGINKKERQIVTKRFVFEASKKAELKKRSIINVANTTNNINGGCDNILEYPTRVEAVSAFIWKCFVELDQAKEGVAAAPSPRVYSVTHAVNTRKRMIPPLPTNAFGNMYSPAYALLLVNTEGEKDHPYPNLVEKIREAIKKIDGEHVKNLQSTDVYLNYYLEQMKNIVSSGQMSTVILHFSSWCGFPIYEADFGWGKPAWAATAPLPLDSVVVLMDTRSGGGIEAWVNLTKEDMAEFERDQELLALVS